MTVVLRLMGVECEPVWSEKWSGDVGLQLVHLASENAQQRIKTYASEKVVQNALLRAVCDGRHTTRSHGLVAPALQGPSLTGNVPHLRL